MQAHLLLQHANGIIRATLGQQLPRGNVRGSRRAEKEGSEDQQQQWELHECVIANSISETAARVGSWLSKDVLRHNLDFGAVHQRLLFLCRQRHFVTVVQAGGDFHAGQVLQRKRNRLLVQAVAIKAEDVGAAVVHAQGVALECEHVLVLRGHDGDADVNVGEQAEVLIVDQASGFAHVSIAAEFNRGGHRIHRTIPDASGDGIPCDLNFLADLETSDIGLVDKGAYENLRQVSFLQHEFATLDEGSLFDWHRIYDAVERGAHRGFLQGIFGAGIGGLRLSALGLDAGNFGLRVAAFLFLLEQREIGLGALQIVFGLADFAGGSRALLLQATEGVEIVLSGLTCVAGFDELRVEGDDFFLGAAGFEGVLVSLSRLDLSLRSAAAFARISASSSCSRI